MFNYKCIISNLLEENIYILFDENKDAIIIDPGLGFHLIDDFIKSNHLNPIAVLATHAHIDHIASAEKCQSSYSIPIYMCKEDSLLIENYEKLAGFWKVEAKKPKITNWIDKNETEIQISNFREIYFLLQLCLFIKIDFIAFTKYPMLCFHGKSRTNRGLLASVENREIHSHLENIS